MNKSWLMLIVIVSVLSVGCASVIVSTKKPLSDEKAYIGGYFNEYTHKVKFENLDTREDLTISFPDKDIPSIAEIPPGRWAIAHIEGKNNRSKLSLPVPLKLLTVIETEPGEIFFLGEYQYGKTEGFFIKRVNTEFKYPFENFVLDVNKHYKLGPDIEPVPFRYMPALK